MYEKLKRPQTDDSATPVKGRNTNLQTKLKTTLHDSNQLWSNDYGDRSQITSENVQRKSLVKYKKKYNADTNVIMPYMHQS